MTNMTHTTQNLPPGTSAFPSPKGGGKGVGSVPIQTGVVQTIRSESSSGPTPVLSGTGTAEASSTPAGGVA